MALTTAGCLPQRGQEAPRATATTVSPWAGPSAEPTAIPRATAHSPQNGAPATQPPLTTTTAASGAQPTATAAAGADGDIEATLQRLTLEQKVAQLLLVGIPGTTVDGAARQWVAERGVGGVVLLERNIESAEQVRELTTALQEAALVGSARLPLFIAWNHEGGDIVRTTAGMTHFPSSMAQGVLDDAALTYATGQAMGAEMASLGVNMNFAPVLDVNLEQANPVIGLRSYGQDAATVARLGAQFIDGQQGAGVIAVAKHFPGHGRADVDSHLALPTVDASAAELWQVDLAPFAAAFQSDVAAVMVAHLDIPALDTSGRPSSLSPAVVTGLLRQQMGFDGVVMTDDLGMMAITDHYTVEEAALLALEAGHDLLVAVEPDGPAGEAERILDTLVGAVRSGRLDEARIDRSLRRLLHLKRQYRLGAVPAGPLLPGQPAHERQALRMGADAVHTVRDNAGWIPLPQQPQHVLLISPLTGNPGSVVGDNQSALAEQFLARGIGVTELFYDPVLSGSTVLLEARAHEVLGSADAAVIVLWDAALHYHQRGDRGQEQLVAALLEGEKPVIAVSGHLPYDDARLHFAPALVNLYGDGAGQIGGLVRLLLGESS